MISPCDSEPPRHCGVPEYDLECVECGVRLYNQETAEVCWWCQQLLTTVHNAGVAARCEVGLGISLESSGRWQSQH